MIKIELNRLNDGFHMEAKNEFGNSVHMDALQTSVEQIRV